MSLLGLAAIGFGMWRLLGRRHHGVVDDRPEEPSPLPSPPRDAVPAAAAPRAMLELAFRPLRAGTNLTGAAVEYEVVVRNGGDATATAIRLDLRLLSGAADQDAVLAALFDAPVVRPIVAPFDLPPGGDHTLAGMAVLPHHALAAITVQGRALFFPMLALNAVYDREGGDGQAAAAWLIGIDRGDGQKMAPFRLDTGPRMYDTVSGRPHGRAVLR